MWKGAVVSIFFARTGGGSMASAQEAHAVPGRGLEGDRYFKQQGTYSEKPGPDRELTLIEAEAIEALNRDYGINIDPSNARRNILTRGVPLNHLVDQEFRVGGVRVRGLRLCEPCSHLESLTAKGIKMALIHRGGLRAQILTEGIIRVGDTVEIR